MARDAPGPPSAVDQVARQLLADPSPPDFPATAATDDILFMVGARLSTRLVLIDVIARSRRAPLDGSVLVASPQRLERLPATFHGSGASPDRELVLRAGDRADGMADDAAYRARHPAEPGDDSYSAHGTNRSHESRAALFGLAAWCAWAGGDCPAAWTRAISARLLHPEDGFAHLISNWLAHGIDPVWWAAPVGESSRRLT